MHSREVGKCRVPRRDEKNQLDILIHAATTVQLLGSKGAHEELITSAVPYLSSPVDGSRSKLCMISSSERKEDGCPGERVKVTLLSEVHLPQEREEAELCF